VLERIYNQVVSFVHATSADELEQVLALLPDVVRAGLAEEVKTFGDAHRYDANRKRAYYFERQGPGVGVWSWNHVYRPHEAGQLIFDVVSLRASLNETLANECYARATGRTVDRPGVVSSDDEAAD
jgi:hypothetical protein